jgi:hypothetical protein
VGPSAPSAMTPAALAVAIGTHTHMVPRRPLRHTHPSVQGPSRLPRVRVMRITHRISPGHDGLAAGRIDDHLATGEASRRHSRSSRFGARVSPFGTTSGLYDVIAFRAAGA